MWLLWFISWYISSGLMWAIAGFAELVIYRKMGMPSYKTEQWVREQGIWNVTFGLIVLWPIVAWKVWFD